MVCKHKSMIEEADQKKKQGGKEGKSPKERDEW